ncbi:ATP-binding protein [Maricaulis sp.]|uniref:sensor histidine kinase n=1 Tax=Maricaulis sp. TaxID=1486257 RepID=UPI00262A4153|nr:ATP-binding protein [Maricaulis sp.]
MIKRPTSAFVQAMLLIGLTALLVQAANIIALVTTPTPSLAQLSLQQASAIVADMTLAEALDIPVSEQSQPPAGRRDETLEAIWSQRLDVAPDRVQIVFIRNTRIELVQQHDVHHGLPRLLDYEGLPQAANIEPEMVVALENTPLPYMLAAYQRVDGSWVVIGEQATFWSGWRLRLVFIFIATLVVLMPLAWFAANLTARPLRELARQVLASGSRDLSGSSVGGTKEVQAVAQAIDDLRDRLDAQLADRERIVAAMAHDLRTPLTGLRLRAEQAPPAARDRMVEDIERMEAMIADVIDYSHSRQQRQSERLDMAELARACAEEAALSGPASFDTDSAPVWVQGDQMKLRRAITNLIGNAQKYGGMAAVTLRVEGDRLALCVDDDGPGIPEADFDRLMEPFQRGEASRNRSTGGAGLGLTVARDVALYHGGALVLSNRPEGGLRAILDLPLMPG